MRKARKMGNYIQHLANENNVSSKQLAELLDFDVYDINRLFKGSILPSFAQIKKLSDFFHISIEELMAGNDDNYRRTVVHCMNKFDNEDNREEILDIIESYILISNSVSNK